IELYRFELRSNGGRRLSVVGSFPRLCLGVPGGFAESAALGEWPNAAKDGTVGLGRPGVDSVRLKWAGCLKKLVIRRGVAGRGSKRRQNRVLRSHQLRWRFTQAGLPRLR
ncbi:uncharacterized protein LY79DRAFT_540844, partial [Colletotrichum navitas]